MYSICTGRLAAKEYKCAQRLAGEREAVADNFGLAFRHLVLAEGTWGLLNRTVFRTPGTDKLISIVVYFK